MKNKEDGSKKFFRLNSRNLSDLLTAITKKRNGAPHITGPAERRQVGT